MITGAKLRILDTPSGEVNVQLSHQFNTVTRFGRSPENDWELPDPSNFVSKFHGKIYKEGKQFFILDSSTNGTLVNNQKLKPNTPARLSAHDVITIGSYVIEFLFLKTDCAKGSGSDLPASNLTKNLAHTTIAKPIIGKEELSHGDPSEDIFSFPSLDTHSQSLSINKNKIEETALVSTNQRQIKAEEIDNNKNNTFEQVSQSSEFIENQALMSLISGMKLSQHTIKSIKDNNYWQQLGSMLHSALVGFARVNNMLANRTSLSSKPPAPKKTGFDSLSASPNFDLLLLTLIESGKNSADIDKTIEIFESNHRAIRSAVLDSIDKLEEAISPKSIQTNKKHKWQSQKSWEAQCWRSYCSLYDDWIAKHGVALKDAIDTEFYKQITQ